MAGIDDDLDMLDDNDDDDPTGGVTDADIDAAREAEVQAERAKRQELESDAKEARKQAAVAQKRADRAEAKLRADKDYSDEAVKARAMKAFNDAKAKGMANDDARAEYVRALREAATEKQRLKGA